MAKFSGRPGIVVGIDPSSTMLGLAAIDTTQGPNGKLIESSSQAIVGTSWGARLELVEKSVHQFVWRHQPGRIGIEAGYVGRDPAAALKLGGARAVCVLVAHHFRSVVVEVPIQAGKAAVTGKGNATKAQVQRMVSLLLGLDHVLREDEADAASIALAAAGKNLTFAGVHGTI